MSHRAKQMATGIVVVVILSTVAYVTDPGKMWAQLKPVSPSSTKISPITTTPVVEKPAEPNPPLGDISEVTNYDKLFIVWVRAEAIPGLPDDLKNSFDGETFKFTDQGQMAFMLLTQEQINQLQALGVAHEVEVNLADHLAQFAPLKTLGKLQQQQGNYGSLETLRNHPVLKQRVQVFQATRVEQRNAQRVIDPCSNSSIVHLDYDEYHTLAEDECFMTNLAIAYPNIVQKVSIGLSVQGRDIWALKITDYPLRDEPEEEKIFFSGETHAREWATNEMMLYLAEYLTTRYGTDARVQRIVNNSVIWLVPVVNPDGFEYTRTNDRMWRKNRRGTYGVDLNRNYDYKWGYDNYGSGSNQYNETYRGPSAASEPETQAIQNLLAQEKFSVAVGYHTYSQLVLYPWGFDRSLAPQSYTSLRAMGKKYVDLVYNTHGQTYVAGQGSYTIYPTNGDSDDYAYGAHGTLSFCPEMRPNDSSLGGFELPEDQILANNEENLAAALWLMDNVANAVDVSNPVSDTIIENPAIGDNFFSLPFTPVHQKPDLVLGLPTSFINQFQAWLDYISQGWTSLNPNFGAAGLNNWQPGFEGCGTVGYGYKVVINDPALQSWADALTSYKVLPYVFEDGADVVLHRLSSDLNVIGIPSRTPVSMQDIRIFRRGLESAGNTWGYREVIVEQRTALEDMNAPTPWIDWNWHYTDTAGINHYSHPTGVNGASLYVEPFQAYQITVNIRSALWGGQYLLRFPDSTAFDFPDCNRNSISDIDELATGTAQDCNGNGILDECDCITKTSWDCNDNSIPDECDIASGLDQNSNQIPDDCERHVPEDYPTIQQALTAAPEHGAVWVAPGIYTGEGNRDLNFLGKALLLQCAETGGCTIDCQMNGRGFDFHNGEKSTSIVAGFLITKGNAYIGGGIYCMNSSPTIRNCTLSGNVADNGGGIMIDNYNSDAIIISNCTIVNNSASYGGGGLCGYHFIINNSIVWGNSAAWSDPQLLIYDSATLRYSDIQGGWSGIGNIDADPLFVNAAGGNYHLSSGSPCIDAGDPNFIPSPGETDIDGQPRVMDGNYDGVAHVDIGADEFNNTDVCGDLDEDGDVDYDDYVIILHAMGHSVGQPEYVAEADYDHDGAVSLIDYRTWFNCYRDFVGNPNAGVPTPPPPPPGGSPLPEPSPKPTPQLKKTVQDQLTPEATLISNNRN